MHHCIGYKNHYHYLSVMAANDLFFRVCLCVCVCVACVRACVRVCVKGLIDESASGLDHFKGHIAVIYGSMDPYFHFRRTRCQNCKLKNLKFENNEFQLTKIVGRIIKTSKVCMLRANTTTFSQGLFL